MQSPNNTVVSLPDQQIIDAAGNTWSIVNGQVALNGVIDPATANVTEMAYENGKVWQKNTDNLWWSKTSPKAQWSPPDGTSVDPIPGQHASANNTVVIAGATGAIFDAQLNEWTIVNGKVMINGVPDGTTARVVQLVLSGGQVWQENADGLWWAKSSPTGSWNPPLGTTQAPVPDPQTPLNTVIVELSTLAPIMDATGNRWTVVNGQVALNGVVDQTTKNVTELAYVNGKVWQENADGLWWSKSTPADQWNPPLGTSRSPVPASTRIWNGNASFSTAVDWTPTGVPQSGDTAVIASGYVIVEGGVGNGVNFNMQGGEADFRSGTYSIGTLSGSGSIVVSYAQLNTTLTTTGVHMLSDILGVAEFATGSTKYNFVVSGNSSISEGSMLTVDLSGTAGLPLGTMQNDGTMQLSGSTLNVGELKGSGSVVMTNDATVSVQISAASSETIKLESGHIDVGGYPSNDHTASMQFLAPVTNFGGDASISLINTLATQEVFNRTGANAGEMLLYNGSTLVADLHLSGQSQFYASNQPASGGHPGGVLITAYDTGHSIPIVSHIS